MEYEYELWIEKWGFEKIPNAKTHNALVEFSQYIHPWNPDIRAPCWDNGDMTRDK